MLRITATVTYRDVGNRKHTKEYTETVHDMKEFTRRMEASIQLDELGNSWDMQCLKVTKTEKLGKAVPV